MNTPKNGQFRHIVFKDGDTWYSVAMEFNIVESGPDKKVAFFNLLQAVDGYIEAMRKIRGARNFSALNQTTDPQYEVLWSKLTSRKPLKSPYQIGMFGVSAVNA